VRSRSDPTDPTTAALTAGRIFAGRYDVREHLGSGGMGEVYRVHDRVLDEEIALKTLTSSLITREGIELFKEEVKLARRVTHKNVARVFDIGRADGDGDGDRDGDTGTLYMTMELIRGGTLRKRMRASPPLALIEALAIGEGIAAGLAAAHEAGIAHRDVKPGNIMLTSAAGASTDVRIIDFGGAQLVARGDAVSNVGTVKYMAPEQLAGEVVGAGADVYALGLVLFEMVAGRPPFGDSNDEEKARARLTQPAPDVRSFVHAPAELAELVARCLSLRAKDRPSAVDVADALHALRLRAPSIPDAFAFQPTMIESLERTASLSTEGARAQEQAHWIAVLPFASTRDDEQGRALAVEVASSLREILSTTAGLRVAPHAGTSRPRADEPVRSLRDVGRALDVDVIVDGALAFGDGGHVTVRARAVDTESAKTLTSAEAHGKIGDVVVLQHGIAERIAEALRVQLAAHAWRGVVSDDAMQMWLRARGRARLGMITDHAVDYAELDRCLAIAPELRPAWAARALVAVRLAMIPVDAHRDWDQTARRAVDDALREAPDHADTQLAAAFLAEQDGLYDDTVARAEEALRLAPSFAEAYELLGRLDVETGRFERGVDRLRWAARLDKRSMSSLALVERGAHFRNRPDLAARIARTLEGRVTLEHVLLKLRLLVWFGVNDRDVEELRGHVETVPFEPGRTLFPALLAIATGGAPTELLKLVDSVRARTPKTRYLLFLDQLSAEVLARSEHSADRSVVLDHVETAAHAGLFDLEWLDRCPPLRAIADDPRFTAARALVARRVGATHAPLIDGPRDLDDDDATKPIRRPR
jgi:serine/threonine protein kinase